MCLISPLEPKKTLVELRPLESQHHPCPSGQPRAARPHQLRRVHQQAPLLLKLRGPCCAIHEYEQGGIIFLLLFFPLPLNTGRDDLGHGSFSRQVSPGLLRGRLSCGSRARLNYGSRTMGMFRQRPSTPSGWLLPRCCRSRLPPCLPSGFPLSRLVFINASRALVGRQLLFISRIDAPNA